MIELLEPGCVVADIFAGIGPFAVPAAMRGCTVYANDLNPKSYEYLDVNVKGNRVEKRVRTYNLDGREFIQQLLKAPTKAAAAPEQGGGASASSAYPASLPFGYFSHAIMNLPASGLTFLDAFAGAFDRATWKAPLPMVHCYCFSKAADPHAEVLAIAEETIGCKLPDATVATVRDVSPHKLMLCVRFRVPDEVAWAKEEGEGDEERAKRRRMAEDDA